MARRIRTARRTKIVIAIAAFSALAACKTSSKPADLPASFGGGRVLPQRVPRRHPRQRPRRPRHSQKRQPRPARSRPLPRRPIRPFHRSRRCRRRRRPRPRAPDPATSAPRRPPASGRVRQSRPSGSRCRIQRRLRRPVTGQKLTGKVIVLDPGHNLNNSSSINSTVYAGNGVYKACDTTGTSTNSRLSGARIHLGRRESRGRDLAGRRRDRHLHPAQ